ncbi:MAG: GxxExxY protein [Deltaproteobacteria bacterium RBG_16_42_7]|nr:MAG: GxxExxY protein [Deltaproteobacteria bacterium RBG_16_42_7]
MLNRRGAETQRENQITEKIIGSAIEVHKALGPGLLESAYEECLCYELAQLGLSFSRQLALPVAYKDVKLDCGYRMDIVVEDTIIVELKTVEKLLPIHEAQLLTYLKLYGRSLGLLVNFNVPVLKDGVKRIVNQFQEFSASQRLCGDNL